MNSAYEPIAIVGIGCRFPGGIDTPQSFWDFLVRGGDGTCEVPESRWNLDRYYDPTPGKPGKVYTKRGGFLGDVSGFDPQFFGISPREAGFMDPQQRLLLETTWEAFEDAGLPPTEWAHHKVGVFVGLFTHDYENIHMRTSERGLYSPHSATGMSTTIAANRLSYAFDFMGPSMVIDTACSSSLVAVHLACRSLQSGESEVAVAAGVNLQLTPEMTMTLCNASMLSPDGRCKSFDARANGYARADGAGVVVLKTLAAAQADGDLIYAVVEGSAVNQDGRSKGITVPNRQSQQTVTRDALAQAGLAGKQISYVEAHGTGTPVGDPIEANALGAVLGDGRDDAAACVIGSVKSNFGHTESAAGVAGLIKIALMQHNGKIPPNLHFETPNPDIPFESLQLRVPTALEEWPADQDDRRYAGINSFGFGGTNAHAVVGKAPARTTNDTQKHARGETEILLVSARSDEAARQSAQRIADFLKTPSGTALPLADIAGALALGRSGHQHRLSVAASDHNQAIDALVAFADGARHPNLVSGTTASDENAGLAFVCSGMGQQWFAMGRGLLKSEPVFAAKFNEIDALFADMGMDRSLVDVVNDAEATSEIDQTECAQRAIFALQVALAALWDSVGIKPDFVVGHSVGEVAAAYIAGALSLKDAITVSFHRSRLQAELAGRGSMLAVGLSETDVAPYIKGLEASISIAAINSAGSLTLAGDTTVLEGLAAELEKAQIFARMLNVEVPYHSPVMDEIKSSLAQALAGIAPQPTHTPLISTVTGALIKGPSLDAAYWNRNVREPVAFARAVHALIDQGCRHFIEIGAHPVLASSIGECLGAADVPGTAITCLRRKKDDAVTFWSAYGQLFCLGYPLDFEKLYSKPATRMDLPTYPWQRNAFWTESAQSKTGRIGAAGTGGKGPHPLLGDKQGTPNPAWRAEISPTRPAYLQDHRVQGSIVFPAAGYIEAAIAASDALAPNRASIGIENLKIEAPLVFGDAGQTYLQVSLGAQNTFEIHSLVAKDDQQHWARHASGEITTSTEGAPNKSLDWAKLQSQLPTTQDRDAFNQSFETLGLQYGPQFQNIDAVWIGADEALGKFAAAPAIEGGTDGYFMHPAILDSAFQLLAALPDDGTYLPVGADKVEIFQSSLAPAWAHVRMVGRTKTRVMADVTLADAEGGIIAFVSGMTCKLFDNADHGVKAAAETFLYEGTWVDAPLHEDNQALAMRPPLPAPADLVAGLQERHNQRDRDGAHKRFVTSVLPALNDLAMRYFIEALSALGFDWQVGSSFSTRQLMKDLSISPRYQSLMAHMLGASNGLVRPEKNAWIVQSAPSHEAAKVLWQSLAHAHPDCHAELTILQRCGTRLATLLGGDDDPALAVFPENSQVSEHLFTDAPSFQTYNQTIADAVAEFVRRLPDTGTLRILEIGAGNSGLMDHMLSLLPPERITYVLSDADPAAIAQAKQKYRGFDFLSFETLDIGEDVQAQGFEATDFDLILAPNALHATADIGVALKNLDGLLRPGGALAMIETTAVPLWHDLVFGLLPDWWAFADRDVRPHHCTLPTAGWHNVLEQHGFDAIVSVSDQIESVTPPQTVILARKSAQALGAEQTAATLEDLDRQTPIVVLADKLGVAEPLAQKLRDFGCNVSLRKADKTLSGLNGVAEPIAPIVVDLRNLVTSDAGETDKNPAARARDACSELRDVVLDLADTEWKGRAALWLITNGSEIVADVKTPRLEHAAVKGFARVVMNEHGNIDTYLVDLSPVPDEAEIDQLARQVCTATRETEIVLRGAHRYVSRVTPHRPMQAVDAKDASYMLRQTARPAPADLAFRENILPPPGPDEVQMRVRATGINYKDFALLTGMVDADMGEMGLEGAGEILAVGKNIKKFAPGDAVLGPVIHGLNSTINAEPLALTKIPAGMSFEAAAGIPVVFISAYHALKNQAGLGSGETILIHTAASGLGLAAVQVARALGAKVFATAGNDEKRSYLKSLGIEYVGDSRRGDFAQEILQRTNGKGVDVVLNTLPEKMNAANIKLLPPGSGRLIDVANLHYGGGLDFAALTKGVSVSAFDLGILSKRRPDYMGEILDELMPLFENGTLAPVPYRHVSIDRLSETVRKFRRATHIGKVVVSHSNASLAVAPQASDLTLSRDKSYLVTGGMTGFGLATAKWLTDNGARHLALVSRRGAATPGIDTIIADMAKAGVTVEAIACDVAKAPQVDAMMARFGADLPPLGGIVHAAMVMDDGPIRDLTDAQMDRVFAPKIDGAWNLHRASLSHDLEFYITYSSVSTLFGNRDQANYAAANEYMEALMESRHAAGLPGLAIGWGVIGSTGYVAREKAVADTFFRQGVYALDLDRAWTTMAYGVRKGMPYLGSLTVDWAKLSKFARVVSTSGRFDLLRGTSAKQAGSEGGTRRNDASFSASDTPETYRARLQAIVLKDVADVLGMNAANLDVGTALPDLGFDSLMAVELSVALEHSTGYGFNRMSLLRPDITASDLIDTIATELSGAPMAQSAEPSAQSAAAEVAESETNLAALSDAEVDAMLRQLSGGS